MFKDRLRIGIVFACTLGLALGPAVNPLFAQSSSVTSRIAGSVIDKASGHPIAGAHVVAKLITTNELFTSPGTDGLGGYVVTSVPAGIYALSIVHDGATFPVPELVDVRMGTTYLLEACFELDTRLGTASLQTECSSGLYAETQVVSLGPHRYFRDASFEAGSTVTTQRIDIAHSGVSCVVSDLHLRLLAGIYPTEFVALGRVFFRARPHPDFYYVDMESAGTGFHAILPRPSPETRQFVYYIEAIDTSSNPVQTQEFTVLVDDCDEDPEALYFQGQNPGIVVGSNTPGAAAAPPGFLSTGIGSVILPSGALISFASGTAAVAATGGGFLGLSTLGLVLLVGAATAATGTVVLLSTGEEEASDIR